jgi:hypothetical protein
MAKAVALLFPFVTLAADDARHEQLWNCERATAVVRDWLEAPNLDAETRIRFIQRDYAKHAKVCLASAR